MAEHHCEASGFVSIRFIEFRLAGLLIKHI